MLILVGSAALSGVYGYATRLTEQRLEDYRRFVVGEVAGVGRSAGEALNRGAASAVTAEGVPDAAAIAREYTASLDYVDRVALADASGTVLVAYPRRLAAPVPDTILAAAATADRHLRYAVSMDATEPAELWVYRTTARGSGHVVFAQVHLASVSALLDRVGREGRIAAIVDSEGGVALAAGGSPVGRLAGASYADQENADGGALSIGRPGESGYVGAWGAVDSLPGVEWRVVIAEPRSLAVRDTWRSLIPGAVVLVVVGVGMAALTYVTAKRMVRPLRELETRARKASDGAYVRPFRVTREDEVGRMTHAFNALIMRLNALHDVTELMAGASSLDQVVEAAMTSLGHIIPNARVGLFLLEETRRRLVLVRSNDPHLEAGMELGADAAGWLGDATDSVGPACPLPAAGRAGLPGPWAGGEPVFTVPLAYGAERVGALILRSESRELSVGEVEMVRTFAAQLAVAVRTSWLFEREHGSRREAEVLRAVAEQLSNPSDLADSLHVVSALAGALLGTARSGIALRQPGAYRLDPETYGDRRGWMALWDVAGRGDASEPDAPLLVSANAGPAPAVEWARERGVVGALLVPLVREGEVCGILGFEYDGATLGFDERYAALSAALGGQVSLALENAFLFEQARLRADNLETVFKISQAVSSSLQSKVVLNRVLDVVQKIFSADAVSLMTYDPARKAVVTAMARGLVSQEMLYLEASRAEDIPGRVFEAQVPVRVGHLTEGEGRLARLATEQGLRSLVAVPLLARGRSIGVLTVLSRSPDAFSHEDMELLTTFATQAALAIENAELFSREHAVASMLQSGLAPGRLPGVRGLDIASEYRPSSPHADIGGDYYDMFAAPDGSVVVVIGDVCGKGVTAATKTSMIKYSLRGVVAAGMRPGEALAALNRMVKEAGETSDIVTVWLGMIDVDAGVLVYANGGHPPALLLDPRDGGISRLVPTGPILGAVAEAPYDEAVVAMPPGAVLVLYTDGVTEARRGNRFFGEGRIRRIVKTERDAVGSVRRLMETLERFSSGALRDDVAVVAVRRHDGTE